jgi:hypothetical protein
MLSNMESAENLRGLARARAKPTLTRTVRPASAEALIAQGWRVEKKTRKSIRLRKEKDTAIWMADRLWTLLYRTGFPYLSAEKGALLDLAPKDSIASAVRLSVIGIDTEVAIAFECVWGNDQEIGANFDKAVEKLKGIRQQFSLSVSQQYSALFKRQIATAVIVPNYSRDKLLRRSLCLMTPCQEKMYDEQTT